MTTFYNSPNPISFSANCIKFVLRGDSYTIVDEQLDSSLIQVISYLVAGDIISFAFDDENGMTHLIEFTASDNAQLGFSELPTQFTQPMSLSDYIEFLRSYFIAYPEFSNYFQEVTTDVIGSAAVIGFVFNLQDDFILGTTASITRIDILYQGNYVAPTYESNYKIITEVYFRPTPDDLFKSVAILDEYS